MALMRPFCSVPTCTMGSLQGHCDVCTVVVGARLENLTNIDAKWRLAEWAA